MANDSSPIDSDAWTDLETAPTAAGRLSARRLTADGGPVLAVDHQRRRHVLLSIASLDAGVIDTRSRGLVVSPRMLQVEDEPLAPFLDICCTDSAGREAFNVVVNDLLDRLRDGLEPVAAVMATLARWRRFWSSAPPEGLSPDEVRGLFGELYFLFTWLLPLGPQHVRSWVGPVGGRNDFQWSTMSVEAKTTASVRGHIHRINGIDQLDPPEHGNLLIYSLRVREEPASTNSLVTIIDAIADRLASEPELLELFENRLAAVGYSPLHADRYREVRYRIVDERLYRVGEGFPRLSASSFASGIPPGVERVEYEVNLEAAGALVVARHPRDMPHPPPDEQ